MNSLRRLFCFPVLLVLFLSCSREKTHSPPKGPITGGTVRISALAEIETLDPQKILFLPDLRISSLLFEGLVALDAHQKPVPLLAESWEKLDDGQRIRFRLRKGVRFQDDPCFPGGQGRSLRASDVAYTFERLADPAVASPNAYLFAGKIVGLKAFHEGKASGITGIQILGEDCVEFWLTKPYYSFLTLLTTGPAQIVPREAVETYGANFGRHPVGSGPFRLARWKPLREILLVKNTHYWQKDRAGRLLPRLDAVQIQLNSNPVLTISEFLKGNLDVLMVNGKDRQELQQQPDFGTRFHIVQEIPDPSVRFLGFSLDKQTLLSRNARLRRAIAQAFPRENLNKNQPVQKKPAKSLVPPFLLDVASSDWPFFAPLEARRIIQRHAPGGVSVAVSSNIKSPEVQLFCQTLQALGFRCKLDIHPVKYYAHILHGRPDIFRVSFLPSYPDPEDYFALFYSKNRGSTNLTGYANPAFDALFEEVLIAQDAQKRRKLFLRMEKLLARDIPAIYLMQSPPATVLASCNVHQVQYRMFWLDFSRTWIGR